VELTVSDKTHQENLELFDYAAREWDEVYREGDTDMLYVYGDPWDPRERQARREVGRQCLCFDELGQYINQRINDIRQNKRAIRIDPQGEGANDRFAALRADIIRTIESQGGIYAYTTGYENALQRGMGAWAVGKRYKAWDSFEQELYIRSIPNARSVYIDPDYKESAASDMKFAFLITSMSKSTFKSRFRGAQMVDFEGEYLRSHSTWFSDNNVQVAECWRITPKRMKTYLIPGFNPATGGLDAERPRTVTESTLPEGYRMAEGGISFMGRVVPVLRERWTERPQVRQYVMSGAEILETTDWEGRWIPVIPCFGRQYWIETPAGSRRIVESLIRKARDAQMMHNYLKTAMHESIGRILKSPYIGYEGQFEGHQDEWAIANRVPVPYLEARATTPEVPGTVLPLPKRNSEDAAIQGYEIADEGVKRSIQNALGMYNTSVGRHDTNVKSGVAIKELDLQSDQGNYHFTDNFDQSIRHTGCILDDMIPHVYDTAREMLLRRPDETAEMVRVNQAYRNKAGDLVEYRTDVGVYDVTVSTGPSYQSQREQAQETADLLLESQFAPLVADLAIKIKNLGPLGDQMAERLTPPQFAGDGEQSAAALAQKLQKMQQVFDALTEQVDRMTREREAKTLELESKEKIAAMQAEVDKLRIQADLMKAHEQMSSKENIEAFKASMQQQLVQLQARIDAVFQTEREADGKTGAEPPAAPGAAAVPPPSPSTPPQPAAPSQGMGVPSPVPSTMVEGT
jgi:hypothetical protein